jgi:uncharacterized peroxidase-related enzyme
MANIKVIQYEESEGQLKQIYDNLIKTRGKLAEVHKIQSLHPESIVRHMDLYMEIMFSRSPLKRVQREMLAVIVSIANNCTYCKFHHGEALKHFLRDDEKLNQIYLDYAHAGLEEKDLLLCDYAHALTVSPDTVAETGIVEKLKSIGMNDRAILDATLVIAYFNFVNRIVLAHELELEADEGKGYEYE